MGWKSKRMLKQIRREIREAKMMRVLVSRKEVENEIRKNLHWFLLRCMDNMWVGYYQGQISVNIRLHWWASLMGMNHFVRVSVVKSLEGKMPVGFEYEVEVV